MSITVGKKYPGVIVPTSAEGYYDPKIRGRYKVHIPELMHDHAEDSGIWCRNRIVGNRMTKSEVGTYGSYFPLHAGTKVLVEFIDSDLNTGCITEIVSDFEEGTNCEAQDCESQHGRPEDRDEQYVIFKTPKKWSCFYANEDTKNEPNTIYLIYNRDEGNLQGGPGRRTVFRIDESGLSFWTRDNQCVRIMLDSNTQISGNKTEYVEGYRTEHVDGDEDQHYHSNRCSQVDADEDNTVLSNQVNNIGANQDHKIGSKQVTQVGSIINRTCGGNTTDYSGGLHAIDGGGGVFINCGMAFAVSARTSNTPKSKTQVRDLGPGETSAYNLSEGGGDRPVVAGNKCDDATNNYVSPSKK